VIKPYKVSITQQVNAHQKGETTQTNTEVITVMQPYAPKIDELRGLRSQLMMRRLDQSRHSIAVVSANEGEGSSYLSANLALMFAQVGKHTLLVDANLRNPQQHLIFNVKSHVGLADILANNAGLEAATQVGKFKNLSLLCAGTVSQDSHELLSQAGFAQFVEQAETQYEVVLIETTPAIFAAELQDVVTHCGAVLLVSRLNQTRHADLIRLRDQIAVTGTQVIGSVINDF
jgi:chain length determinant protein tyrosine kinase EpsG